MNNALKWRLVFAFVVVFVAGVAVGVMGAAHHARDVFLARHSMQLGDRMREHLHRQLNLTPEQFEKVAPIVDEMSRRLEVIRDDTRKRVTETMEESHREIVPLLTPEQCEKLEQMKRRHEHMLRGRGSHRPMHKNH